MTTRERLLGTLAVMTTLVAVVPVAASADGPVSSDAYHVSTRGSDRGDGSARKPWRTIQKAVSAAPAGSTILVARGTYKPFVVRRPGQTVRAEPGQRVVVRSRHSARNGVLLAAPGTTVSDITITGCVPNPTPAGGFENGGSAAVRIDDGATGATVRNVTIRNSRGVNQYGLPFGCFGVLAHRADGFAVVGNDISGTGTGVFVSGGGKGAVIANNRIHDNDVIIRNTPVANDDFGGNGITFANVDAVPGVLATHNTITGNSGPSADYDFDGGAFEIFNSSHVRMVANTIADNENVLETGTAYDANNPLGDCIDNEFVGNQVSGRSSGSRLTRSIGLILRCATGMAVADNTFTDIDWFVYAIFSDDVFSSDVVGLAVTGNQVDQWQKVYHLGLDPLASHVVVEANRMHFTGPVFASYGDGSTSATLAQWQTRSGQDRLTTTY